MSTKPESRAGLLLTLLAFAGLAAAFYEGWIPLGLSAAPAPGGEAAVSPSLPLAERGALDPSPYRGEIEAIEAVLYMGVPPELGDPERVAALAMELGERIHAELGPLAGRSAMIELLTFASEAQAQGEIGYAAPDLASPRRSWETLRTELFRTAPWFRSAGPDLASVQRRPEPVADPVQLSKLRAWADDLDVLVAAGRREMMGFGEHYVDVAEGSREERVLVAEWNAFARAWDARVTRACASAPSQPGMDGEPNVTMAWQSLGQAAHQVRIATVSPAEWSVPDKHWREQSLANASAQTAEARRYLEQAQRQLEHARR